MVEESGRRDRDFEMAFERFGKTGRLTLHGQFRVPRQAGRVEQGGDHGRIVAGDYAERVAGLVGEARAGDVELDVAGLLGRIAADDDEIVDDPGREGIALVERGRGRKGGVSRGGHLAARPGLGNKQGQRLGAPLCCRLVKVDVAFGPIRKPDRSERLEPPVEPPAGLAIMLVGRIAQGQDRIAKLGKLRRLRALDELEEVQGGLGRVALAMGADDDEQILLLPKPPRLVAGHVLDLGDEALVRRGRREGPGEPGAIAGLAAVEDGQSPDRRPPRRAGARCRRPAGRFRLRGRRNSR